MSDDQKDETMSNDQHDDFLGGGMTRKDHDFAIRDSVGPSVSEGETAYRINYTIARRLPGEADFTDIGTGSSGEMSDLSEAVFFIESDITHGQWHTTDGQPDPNDIVADCEAALAARMCNATVQ